MKIIVKTNGDSVESAAAFEKIGSKAKKYLKEYHGLTDEQIKLLLEEDVIFPNFGDDDEDDIGIWIVDAEFTAED